MATGALKGPRLLSKNIPKALATYEGDDGSREWGMMGAPGWVPIQPSGNYGIYYETYWDCSGYTRDELTVVPTAITLQDGMPYFRQGYATPVAESPNYQIFVVDIVSQERLDPLAIWTDLSGQGEFGGSSDTATRTDWNQILYWNVRYFSEQNNFANPGATPGAKTLLLPSTGGQYGSQSPTTAAKLWIYRLIVPKNVDPVPSAWIEVPATRFVMAMEVVEEKGLEFLMRQKRSYELATQR